MNNIKDVLTGYFMQDDETIRMSKKLRIPLEDIAEIRANEHQHTEWGKELYNELIEMFRHELELLKLLRRNNNLSIN